MIRKLFILLLLAATPIAHAATMVFARGADKALWYDDGSGWKSLGGELLSAPDATASGDRVDVFVRGRDKRLWQIARVNGRWTEWVDHGGTLAGGPSAVARGNRIDVFAVDLSGSMKRKTWDGVRWSDWQSHGGQFAEGTSPDATSWGADRVDVFARGTDNALWQIAFDGTRWTEWNRLGGEISSDPGAISWGPNRIDVFARGTDGQMWQIAWDGSEWTEWIAQEGEFARGSGPDAATGGVNRLAIYARGTDNAIWRRNWDGNVWSEWTSLGGVLDSDPAAVTFSDGSQRARFRVSVTGITINRETWDDVLERDGKRDEVFLVHEARVFNNGAALIAAVDPIRGAVHGDINRDDWRTTRVQAGSASDLGGLRTGDEARIAQVLWEGELASGGNSVVIVPTIWEWDGEPDFLNRALGFLGAPIVLLGEGAGLALNASPETLPDQAQALLGHVFRKLSGRGELGSAVTVNKNVFGDAKDRPIGMKDAGIHYVFEPQALHLTFETASEIARMNFGRGMGVLPVRYRDAEALKGDYTLNVQIEVIR